MGLLSLPFLQLARRIRAAVCGRELARLGYALFVWSLAVIVLAALGTAIDTGSARPLSAGERLWIAGVALVPTASVAAAVRAYLRRSVECPD